MERKKKKHCMPEGKIKRSIACREEKERRRNFASEGEIKLKINTAIRKAKKKGKGGGRR